MQHKKLEPHALAGSEQFLKLGIIGTGMVGSTAAYVIVSTGVASSLVLIDHDPQLALAQAADISASMTEEVAGVQDVCLSLPRILGAGGIEGTLIPAMTQAELEALGASARMLKETTDALEETNTARQGSVSFAAWMPA